MKEYIELHKEHNHYYGISKRPITALEFLRGYFEVDYKSYYEEYVLNQVVSSYNAYYEEYVLNQVVSSYNAYFVYHDKQNEMLYIGQADWESDEEIDRPSDIDFPHYVNESNSCKMSIENYLAFRTKWVQLKQELPPFALIYRDDQDWIDCKGFATQEAMELFIAEQGVQIQKMSSFHKIGVIDPEELDRKHASIPYNFKIHNFLQVVQPHFRDKHGNIYYVKDFSSVQIHAGDYSIMNRPRGGHSNFGGHNLDYFNPLTVRVGYLDTKDLLLRNARFPNLIKFSYVYPESWSEYLCDLKAIEALMSDDAQIMPANVAGVLKIVGHTSENLEIVIFYEIKTQKIRMHYPNIS